MDTNKIETIKINEIENMDTNKIETKKTNEIELVKKKPNGLINAAKIVGLVYFIVDIVALVIFVILGIVALVGISQAKTEEAKVAAITTGVLYIVFSGIFIAAIVLANKAWKNLKNDVINSKGLSIANIIFNTALGILTLIIFNKKQAGEF